MSVEALDTREDKIKWITRPFCWAYDLAWFLCLCGIAPWYFGDVMPYSYLCAILFAGLATIAGLLLWGIARVTNVARGRL
jgi:hypothetical protein